MVAQFNEEYPRSEKMSALLTETFHNISNLGLPLDSMWFRKSNFFTLVVETARNLQNLPNEFKIRLEELEQLVMDNRRNADSAYSLYYSYMYQATHARKARVVRGAFFARDVIGKDVEVPT